MEPGPSRENAPCAALAQEGCETYVSNYLALHPFPQAFPNPQPQLIAPPHPPHIPRGRAPARARGAAVTPAGVGTAPAQPTPEVA